MKKLIALVLALVCVLPLVGCGPSQAENGVEPNISRLQEKYPQFFNVSTDGGLKVYIWQIAENEYRCYLVNKTVDALADQSFIFETGATVAEMRAILSDYNVEKEDIVIHPVVNPLSSYYCEIDDAYIAKVNKLFWED